MSQMPTSPTGAVTPSGGKLPRVVPASAFGIFICCVGYIWTVLSYLQVLGGINKMDPSANLQWWTLFVPIYGNLYFSNVIKALNKVGQANGQPPLDDNMIIHLLVPILSLFQIFGRYNQVADAVEGTKPA